MENVSGRGKTFLQQNRKKIVLAICIILLISLFLFWQTLLSGHPQKLAQQPLPVTQPAAPLHLVPSGPAGPDRVSGQILVKFKQGLSQTTIANELSRYHSAIKQVVGGIGTTVLSVPKGQENIILLQLQKDGLVEYSEPNYIRRIQFAPNDTDFVKQWGLFNTGQAITIQSGGKTKTQQGIVGDDIHVEAAWDVSKGDGVKVAIIDTGIDLTHPDLVGKVVLQKDFVTTSATTIDDKFGHGTHVAGIIAATTNNTQGIAGVCPNCQLVIAKAMDDNGNGQDADIANAITWAADNGAKVINMSEGGLQPSQTEDAAINYAWNKGAVIIAAAGNSGVNQLFYPAASQNVVSVTATDNVNGKASFSNFGTWVNLTAPGLAILSTLPTHPFGMQSQEALQQSYDYLSGTSMAAPIVSGVAGLVWASPLGTSNTAVVARLLSTADKINGTGIDWKDGLVDAEKAVGANTITPTAIPTITPGVPTPTFIPTPTTLHPTFMCLGACPTLPPSTTPQPNQTTTPVPSGTTGSPSPSQQVTPTTNPCLATTSTQQSVTAVHSRHRQHIGGGLGNGLLADFLNLLKQLIALLMQLLNGTTPPTGNTTITPTPANPTPSVAVSPTTGSSPSPTQPCPSITPTTIPSVTPSVPTASLTPSTTLQPSPTLSPTQTVTPTISLTPSLSITPTVSITPLQTPTLSPAITPISTSTTPLLTNALSPTVSQTTPVCSSTTTKACAYTSDCHQYPAGSVCEVQINGCGKASSGNNVYTCTGGKWVFSHWTQQGTCHFCGTTGGGNTLTPLQELLKLLQDLIGKLLNLLR